MKGCGERLQRMIIRLDEAERFLFEIRSLAMTRDCAKFIGKVVVSRLGAQWKRYDGIY